MDDHLTDRQRAEQIRVWLSDNGWSLLAGLVLGLAALFGWRQWDGYRTTEAEEASAIYEELLASIRVERTSAAEELAAQIASKYGSTPYVDQARLAMAKLKLDRSLPEEAAQYLKQVVDHPSSAEIGHIARLRLGRVLVQQEKYEEALEVLEPPQNSAFAPRFHDVRGDAYHAMGRLDEARSEYAAALTGNEESMVDQAFVQAKLDALSAGTATATGPAVGPGAATPAAD